MFFIEKCELQRRWAVLGVKASSEDHAQGRTEAIGRWLRCILTGYFIFRSTFLPRISGTAGTAGDRGHMLPDQFFCKFPRSRISSSTVPRHPDSRRCATRACFLAFRDGGEGLNDGRSMPAQQENASESSPSHDCHPFAA